MRVKNALEKLIFLPISILLLSSSNYQDDVDRRLSLWPDVITINHSSGIRISLNVNKKTTIIANADDMAKHFMDLYPSLEMIAPPTNRYNCHSYSLICHGSFNVFNEGSPEIILELTSLYEPSEGNVGDIVLYLTEDNDKIHSGIIKERLHPFNGLTKEDLKNITVVSKRGGNALFEHQGDEFNMINEVNSIRYFKLSSSHKHNYDAFSIPIDDNYHANVCTCGDYIKEGHMLSAGSFEGVEYASCLYCNGYVCGGIYVR